MGRGPLLPDTTLAGPDFPGTRPSLTALTLRFAVRLRCVFSKPIVGTDRFNAFAMTRGSAKHSRA